MLEMKKGLIIGRFIPPHAGHMALIHYACKRCDKLTVCICTTPEDSINGTTRYRWMKQLLKGNVTVKMITSASLPHNRVPTKEGSILWAEHVKKRFSPDIIFSSEKYGNIMAEHLGIKFDCFDMERKRVPISATMIRENPKKYANYIPAPVKKHYSRRSLAP